MMQNPKVKDIMHKFKRAKEKRQYRDRVWEELDKFDRGDQWDGNIPSWIPKPVTNMIHLVKTTKRAAFAIENPTGEMRSLSPEDQESIQDLNRIQRYVWAKIGSRKVVREIIETGKLLGTSIVHFTWDEDVIGGGRGTRYEGEIKVKQIDPSMFFPDPSAHTLEDCQFIHLVERKPLAWVKSHPKFKKKAGELEETFKSGQELGEIYTRDSTASGKEKIIDFHTHYFKEMNKDGDVVFKVIYLAGNTILHEQELVPNCYPFVLYEDYPQRQEFWAKSTCEYILDNQKLLNKVEQILAVIGTMLQNPQAVVDQRSGINAREAKKYSLAPGHVFVSRGNPERAIVWRQPPQIPQALFNLAEQAKQNIREITGITQSYTGESVGSLQTSSGVNQLIERATMRDRDQMFDLELFIEGYVRLMMKFVTSYYSEERYARVLGEDGLTEEFMSFVGTDYADIDYDYHIDVSSEAPMSKQRQVEEADKLLNIQGQYQFDPPVITPEEYVRKSRFGDKESVLARMEFDKTNSQIEMLMRVVEMLGDAETNGVPNEESMAMAQQMIEQYDQQRNAGLGSTAQSNMDGFQQRQQGIQM